MSSNHFPTIDYVDLIEDLREDLNKKIINESSLLYIVRQKESITLDCTEGSFYPIVDFFYTQPELASPLTQMTIIDAKKLCYSSLDVLKQMDNSNNSVETFSAFCSIIASDLSDYTKGKSKRNNEHCFVLLTKSTDTLPSLPMMVYLQDEAINPVLETGKAKDILIEMQICCPEEK